MGIRGLAVVVALVASVPVIACDLQVEGAWIREPPGNSPVLAGYARLHNTGQGVLRVRSLESADFASVMAHESTYQNGMEMMRPVDIAIAARGRIEFAPGGKHFMLMNPKRALKAGDAVTVAITDATGCVTSASFVVRKAP